MVPATKPDPSGPYAPENFRPAANSFGKVLSSIQGLQKRLDDFSLEEAEGAGAKAQALIQKLKALQAQLTLVEKLRKAAAETKQIVAAIPQADFALVAPDSLDNHPQLRAIIQAGKLIRTYRLLQTARASADAATIDFDALLRASSATGAAGAAAARAFTALALRPGVDAETAHLETPPAALPLDDATVADEVIFAPDLTVKHGGPSAPLTEATEARSGSAATTYDFAELKLDDFTLPPRRGAQSASPQAKPAGQRAAGAKRDKTAPNKSHFDERLLTDVIETYGEFIGSSNATKAVGPTPEFASPIPAPPDIMEQLPAVPGVALVPANAGPEAPIALPPPQAEEDQEVTVEAFVPSIKNRVEIDRQLKSIIKDYGEYDLYSHAKPSKFNKAAAIAAFVVLGLILGGFYLLKSPPPDAPVSAESVAPAQATSDSPANPTPHPTRQNNR